MNPKNIKGKSWLQLDFLPIKKVYVWFGLVWFGKYLMLIQLSKWKDFNLWWVNLGYSFKANPTVISNQLKTEQNSWPKQRTCCNFGSIWWISTCKGSIWGSFSWPIQLWAQISCTLYKTADIQRDITIT